MNEPLDGFPPPLDNTPDPEDRRDFLRKMGLGSAVVAGAAVGGPLVGAGNAFAAPAGEGAALTAEAARFLPEIGTTIRCSCKAFGATLFVNLPPPLPRLDFIGEIVVKVSVGGPTWVRLQVLDHTVRASHPLFGGITIKLPDIDIAPFSRLDFLGIGNLLQTMLLSFNITFDRCGPCEGPFTFKTLEPAKVVGQLTSFPPPSDGIVYGLQNVIKLGTLGSDGPDAMQYARFKEFNINVSH
jgi:hypothetical protein